MGFGFRVEEFGTGFPVFVCSLRLRFGALGLGPEVKDFHQTLSPSLRSKVSFMLKRLQKPKESLNLKQLTLRPVQHSRISKSVFAIRLQLLHAEGLLKLSTNPRTLDGQRCLKTAQEDRSM